MFDRWIVVEFQTTYCMVSVGWYQIAPPSLMPLETRPIGERGIRLTICFGRTVWSSLVISVASGVSPGKSVSQVLFRCNSMRTVCRITTIEGLMYLSHTYSCFGNYGGIQTELEQHFSNNQSLKKLGTRYYDPYFTLRHQNTRIPTIDEYNLGITISQYEHRVFKRR